MISAIIPSRNELYLNRTIKSLYDNAQGDDIEVIAILDGEPATEPVDSRAKVISYREPKGRRVGINDAARIARGDYLFILDGHCSMSKDWNTKLEQSSQDNTIVICVIMDMDKNTWEVLPGEYGYVYLNDKLEEKWWDRPKPWPELSETMCFTGCAWIIAKDYFWKLDGYDESLGEYGWDGPEWTMKVWLNDIKPGKLLLHTGVICGHIFGTNDGGKQYPCTTIGHKAYYEKMNSLWGPKVQTLWDRFPDAPVNKGAKQMTGQKVVFTTIVNKVDDVVEKDLKGNIVSRKKIFYKPYRYEHDGSEKEEDIKAKVEHLITEVDREEKVA